MRRKQANIADVDFRCGACGHPLHLPHAATDMEMVRCGRCGVNAGSLGHIKDMAASFIVQADRRRTRPAAPRKPQG